MDKQELERLAKEIGRQMYKKWMDEFFDSLQSATDLYLLEHPEHGDMVEYFINYIETARQAGKGL